MKQTLINISWLAGAMICAGLTACGGGDDAGAQGPPGRGGGPHPAIVKVEAARDGTLTDSFRYLGYVKPKHAITVAAGVAGQVLTVAGREGDAANEGDPVVTLDTTIIEPRLNAAKAQGARAAAALAQARRELARAEKLPHPVVTDAERERFRATVATLSAEVQSARASAEQVAAELARHTVIAPFAGVIAARHVDPGAWVNPGQPLVDLVSVGDVEVHVDVAARLHSELAPGVTAQLRKPGIARATGPSEPASAPAPADGPTSTTTATPQPAAPQGDGVAATIRGVVPSLDSATRTLRIRLEPDAAAAWLLPNAPVLVEFALTITEPGAVIVSRDALVRGPVSVRVVKVIGESEATTIQVDVIATAGSEALVRGPGLAPGDTIVNRGNERLRPGQPVKVAP